MLNCWFLVIGLKRFFEGVHHLMYKLLEESLKQFEDAKSEMQSPTSSLVGFPQGESSGQGARSQNAPSEAVKPSALSQVAPSELRAKARADSSSSNAFKEEEV